MHANDMNVEECIKRYIKLCELVIRKEYTLSTPEGPPKFDSGRLRYVIEEMLENVTGENAMLLTPSDNTSGCHTFMVSLQSSGTESQARIFRTYDPSETASISEALLATIADPMLFTPLTQGLISETSGGTYGDKIVSANLATASSDVHEDKLPEYSAISSVERSNPTAIAISEAKQLWETIAHLSIINIGAGKQYNAVLFTPPDLASVTLEKIAHHPNDIATHLLSLASDYTFTNFLGLISLQMSMKCEEVFQHIFLTSKPESVKEPRVGPCIRFNVDKGVDLNRGYEECTEIDYLARATEVYMQNPMQKACREQCVEELTHPLPSKWYWEKFFLVPYQRNPYLTGRDQLLSQLRMNLTEVTEGKFNHRVALFGMGGVGKTQIALEYVYLYREAYESVFWLSGVDQASLLSGFQEVAQITGCSEPLDEVSPLQIAQPVLEWLQAQRSWLVVIDNVDDISVVNGVLPDRGPNKHIILTTRNPNVMGIPAEGLEVPPLSLDESLELLMSRSRVDMGTDPQTLSLAADIVKELGYLPLAIEQAAAFIREGSLGYASFLEIYRNYAKDLHGWVPEGNRNYSYSIATTWSMTFQILQKNTPSAAEMLTLLSFLNPDGISIEFLNAGLGVLDKTLGSVISSSFELVSVFKELARFSLIRRVSPNMVAIHRLVQAVIRDNLSPLELERWTTQVVDMCATAFPSAITNETRYLCRAFQGQVVRPLLQITNLRTREMADIMRRVGVFLRDDGSFRDSERLLQNAVSIYKEILGPEHPDSLAAMSNLAETYRSQGQLRVSAEVEESVFEAAQRVLGIEHPDTLTSLNNLSLTYYSQGRWEEAVILQERVSEARKSLLGEDHPDTLNSLNTLAMIYDSQGRWDEAVSLQERVSEARRRLLGKDHPDTLNSLNNLAMTYFQLIRMEDAAKLLEQVLERKRVILGSDHPSTLTTMKSLGLTYFRQGRTKEAALLQEKALEVSLRILGEQHPNTLDITDDLASTYAAEGRVIDAAQLLRELLKMRKTILGETRSKTLITMGELTSLSAGIEENNMSDGESEVRNSLEIADTFRPNVDPAEIELKCWRRLNKHPTDDEFQEELANCYAIRNDPAHAVAGWVNLVRNHPNIYALQSRLSEAYNVNKDQNAAIAGWLSLWESHPTNVGLLRNLRDACNLKYQPLLGQSDLSLFYIAWLGLFSMLSRWLLEWDIDEVDWWPFVSEDELMMLRPYMVKYQWRCVTSPGRMCFYAR